MDARRTRWWAWSPETGLRTARLCRAAGLCSSLVLVLGCTWDRPPPAYQPQPATPKREEPPQVVQKPAASQPAKQDAETDDVSSSVLGWVRRVNDAQQRARARDAWAPDAQRTDRHAADVEPALATRPAQTRPVVIQPKPVAPGPPADLAGPLPTTQMTAALQPPPSTQAAAAAPPVLAGVVVRPAPVARTAAANPAAPAVNAPAAARTGPASLREFLAQTPAGGDDSFQQQVDQRMLWAVAGDYDRAREPLKLVTAEQQELASRFIEAWVAIREGHMGDLAGAASAAGRQLAELQEALRRLSDLSIPVLKICSAVRGYGQYEVVEPPRFTAGNPGEFVLYCELRDFASERRNDGLYYTTFDMTTTLLNRAGDNVLELKDADLVDRCQNRRHDCFIPRLVRLPATLSPGQYVAKVTVADKLGQKVAESCVTFQVVARP